MATLRFELAEVLILDSMPASRTATKNTLYDIGFRNLYEVETVEQAREHINSKPVNLLISDAYLNEGQAAKLFLNIRNGDVGKDPFLPIIALTWQPTVEIVHSIVNSGADLMLTLPMSVAKLGTAVKNLIDRRKPFVVTSAYFGPDRRKGKHTDGEQVPLITVPNSLRRLVTGDKEGETLESAVEMVKEQRVQRHVAKITYTVGQITGLGGGDAEGSMEKWFRELHESAQDLETRISDTRYSHLTGLCASLLDILNGIAEMGEQSASDMEILQQLALAIEVGIARDDMASVDAALNIAGMVQSTAAAV